ncbi:GDP-mannose 4,6-dehydratase [Actinomarinicola tropica]|uniref:NAD-dependent epimerase/dehydratase family protein n=1 Tax=Actinomarinicola tropica TaxID=2789776 RepID=A0A5Q2RLG5_9ACTN|nr:GDP-mannose 4,6-dehydratase [Actinomarinicola tropica]QGG96324.1 NAD-dependent epimerase/dehydratase family protein [Actinomarinicola tropica]
MSAAADRDWSGRRVAVTGAGGFVGSQLVAALVDRGASVHALTHYRGDGSAGRLDLLDAERRVAIDVHPGDVRDVEWVRRAVDGCDVVFHLAAHVGIPHSYRAPRDVLETNTVGTLNVLEALRAGAASRVVQMSTSEVYGSAQRTPIDEEHPLNAQSPYAASKVGADQLALSFHRSFGIDVALARPFNVYGPGQTARAIVPTVLSQAIAGGQVRLGSTWPTRDLTFVEDTVAGLLAIGACADARGQVLNIGTGVETSIGRLVDLVAEVVGRPLEIVTEEARTRPRSSEVDRLVADASRLRALTGWEPSVDLRAGLERTAAWIRDHREMFDVTRFAL